MPYDAFMSYSRTRPLDADVLGEILRGGNYSYFRDTISIPDGGDWQLAIDAGLKQSTVLLVLVTSEAENSEGVKHEIALAAEMRIPYLALVVEKYADISVPLHVLKLDKKQAIDAATSGLASVRDRLLGYMKAQTDAMLKLKPSIDALSHFSPHTRLQAVAALAESNNPIIIPHLQQAYSYEVEDNPETAMYIFERLGVFDDERIVQMALDIYEKTPGGALTQGNYRGIATDILERWGAHDPNVIEWAFEQMEKFDGQIDDCCRILRNSDEATRARAIEWLKMKTRTVDGYISYYVNGLRILGDPRVLGFLKETLSRQTLSQIDKDALHLAIQEITNKTTT